MRYKRHSSLTKEWPNIAVPEGSLAHLFPGPDSKWTGHRAAVWAYCRSRDVCVVDKQIRGWANDEHCKGTILDLHEGIISRQDVRGWTWDRKLSIHTPYNCIVLCRGHHETEYEPSRVEVANWMLWMYQRRFFEWIDSLPFKPGSHPLKGWLEAHR